MPEATTRGELLDELTVDLDTEGDLLRAALIDLDQSRWSTPTPAPGWSVAHQMAHLLWTDEVATLAAGSVAGAEGKAAWDEVVLQAIENPTGFVDAVADDIATASPRDLLTRWDAARGGMIAALREFPAGEKMPWFGPPMSATSMATARFMETWAHARDVYEALGTLPEPTDRIRHVAHLGIRTRGFAFSTAGIERPDVEPRVELVAPSGEVWAWGPEDSAERVTGSAIDFCLLNTQRIHRADTDLLAIGPGADAWLDIAQCFAGPPGAGREQRDG